MNENNNNGVPSLGLFGATPSPSPDGGTWIGYATGEHFGQTVSGFDIGTLYSVSWSQSNFGYDFWVNPNSIELSVDGIVAGSGSLLSLVPGWTSDSVLLTATSTTQTLSFGMVNHTVASDMGIDGISVSVVLEPSTALLLGMGLVAMGATRRRSS